MFRVSSASDDAPKASPRLFGPPLANPAPECSETFNAAGDLFFELGTLGECKCILLVLEKTTIDPFTIFASIVSSGKRFCALKQARSGDKNNSLLRKVCF